MKKTVLSTVLAVACASFVLVPLNACATQIANSKSKTNIEVTSSSMSSAFSSEVALGDPIQEALASDTGSSQQLPTAASSEAAVDASTDTILLAAAEESQEIVPEDATNTESELLLDAEGSDEAESTETTEETEELSEGSATEETEAADVAVPVSTVESVEQAKNGVVQINTVFDDSDGKKHIICGGSGFIIGDATQTEYIITNNHLVNISKATKKAALKYYKISNKDNAWDSITPYTEVVFENDVTVTCTVVTASENLDLCVLQMASPNHNRTPLTMLVKDKDDGTNPYDTTDAVYGLGYPEQITYEKPSFYSNDQVSMSSGKIANVADYNGAKIIQHDAQVAENNCGGPLLNDNGLVIGMNLLVDDGNNYCSLDATDIAKILDSLGIEYNKMTRSEYEVWLHRNDVTEPEAAPAPAPVIPTPQVVPDKPIPKWLIATVAILIALVVILIALFLVMVISQKKKDAPKEKKPRKKKEKKEKELVRPFSMPEVNKANESKTGGAAMETSALAAPKNEENGTTILGGSPLPVNNNGAINGGTLIRKKTGDNLLLCKAETTIGKDSLRVDYCIRDNSAISRVHAAIKVNNSGSYLEDRGSTNGTFLNGVRLNNGEEKLLSVGDIIRLANEEFEYRK